MKAEEDAWIEVTNHYNAIRSEVAAEMDRAASAKAKGKQRAVPGDDWDINPRDLPEHFRGKNGIELALRLVSTEVAQQDPLGDRLDRLEETVRRNMQTFDSFAQTLYRWTAYIISPTRLWRRHALRRRTSIADLPCLTFPWRHAPNPPPHPYLRPPARCHPISRPASRDHHPRPIHKTCCAHSPVSMQNGHRIRSAMRHDEQRGKYNVPRTRRAV